MEAKSESAMPAFTLCMYPTPQVWQGSACKKEQGFAAAFRREAAFGNATVFGSFLLQFLNLLVKLASRLKARGKSHRFPMASFRSE